MAPPAPRRWTQGWTDGQSPPPPGTVPLNGGSPIVARLNGAGSWVASSFGQITPADTVLVLTGGVWTEAPLPAAGIVLAQQFAP